MKTISCDMIISKEHMLIAAKETILTHMTLSVKSYVRLNKILWHWGNVKYTLKCSLRYWMEK